MQTQSWPGLSGSYVITTDNLTDLYNASSSEQPNLHTGLSFTTATGYYWTTFVAE